MDTGPPCKCPHSNVHPSKVPEICAPCTPGSTHQFQFGVSDSSLRCSQALGEQGWGHGAPAVGPESLPTSGSEASRADPPPPAAGGAPQQDASASREIHLLDLVLGLVGPSGQSENPRADVRPVAWAGAPSLWCGVAPPPWLRAGFSVGPWMADVTTTASGHTACL